MTQTTRTAEQRFLLLGQTFSGKLVVVAHLIEDAPDETMRIISARLAAAHERRTYDEA
jgi:uncharacterized DUF497 family protein